MQTSPQKMVGDGTSPQSLKVEGLGEIAIRRLGPRSGRGSYPAGSSHLSGGIEEGVAFLFVELVPVRSARICNGVALGYANCSWSEASRSSRLAK